MSSLISATELKHIIETNPPVIIDCQSNLTNRDISYDMYNKQHIPGALYVHLEENLSGEIIPGRTGRHPLPSKEKLQDLLRRLGIDHESHVVIYDQGNAMFASRAWWLFRWAGIKNVQVLNGGLQNWIAQAGNVSTEIPTPTPSNITIQPHDDWVISLDELIHSKDNYLLLDARARTRYLGEQEPLDSKAGHIPSAGNADFAENLLDGNTFKPIERLKERFAPLQNQSKPVVCYCGSGVTACHNILAICETGLTMPRLYPGSWSEWSLDDSRPVSTIEEGIQL